MQDTFCLDRKSVAMVTAYFGKNVKNLASRSYFLSIVTNSHEIWHRCLPWGVDVHRHNF